MRYTFDDNDDEEVEADETSGRRSGRQTGTSTPAEGPTFTTSGRQVRSQYGRSYGDSSKSLRGRVEDASGRRSSINDEDEQAGYDAATAPRGDGRARRPSGANANGKARPLKNYDSMDADDSESGEHPSGGEWEGDDNDFDGKMDEDEDDDLTDADDDSLGEEDGVTTGSKIVSLKVGKEGLNAATSTSKDAAKDESSGPLANDTPSKPAMSTSKGAENGTGLGQSVSTSQQMGNLATAPPSNQRDNIVLGISKAHGDVGDSSPAKTAFVSQGLGGGPLDSIAASNGVTGNANAVPNGTAASELGLATDIKAEPAMASVPTPLDPIQRGDVHMNGT